ncbi:MAG: phospho-N-acetylmuramoyl-pentapeptide-transferase [Christensenellaceae bacterium]
MEFLVYMLLTILIAFVITFVAAKIIIPVLKKAKAGQHVRDDGPQSHLIKEGTPTMGGIIILIGIVISSFIFARGDLRYTVFAVVSVIAFSLIGFMDDSLKLFKKRSLGLRAWQKIVLQFLVALGVALFAYYYLKINSIYLPVSGTYWNMGIGFIPFTMFVLIAMVNSVNLTDGLDGLATGITLINAVTFLAMLVISTISVAILSPDIIADNSNLIMFIASVVGACLAFMFFNAHPAKVFMGDTGSFALGAALTVMGITTQMQLFIPIMGFMFVLSAISVIIQVGSYKIRKKRVFKMAPLHHHFELMGVEETRVVSAYLIASMLLSIGCLLLFVM